MRKTILALCLVSHVSISAQDKSTKMDITLTTEMQWNTNSGRANNANLLNIDFEHQLWKGSSLQATLLTSYNIHTSKSSSKNIAADKQVFSNILLEDPLVLSLFRLGIEQHIGKQFHLFLGMSNLNVDYFNSPYSSLFTNSSNGIYPTIADNWGVANYPNAAMSLHAEWQPFRNFYLRTSIYNGVATNKWKNLFRIAPHSDGFIWVNELSYNGNEEEKASLASEYRIGALYGNTPCEGCNTHKKNYSFYALIEQPLSKGKHKTGVVLQGGYSPKSLNSTYLYYGAGIVTSNVILEGDKLGINLNRALYREGEREIDVETTYQIPINKHITLQPSLHILNTSGKKSIIGIARAVIDI